MNGTLVINRKTRRCKLFVEDKNEMVGCIVKAKDSTNVIDGAFSGLVEFHNIKFYELEDDADYINSRILMPQAETTPEGDLLKKEVVAYIQPIDDTLILIAEGTYVGNGDFDFNTSDEPRCGTFSGQILLDFLPVSRPMTDFNKEVEGDQQLDEDKLAELTEEREILLANNGGTFVRMHQTKTIVEESKKAAKVIDERKAEEAADEVKVKPSEDVKAESELEQIIMEDVNRYLKAGMQWDGKELSLIGKTGELRCSKKELIDMTKNQQKKFYKKLMNLKKAEFKWRQEHKAEIAKEEALKAAGVKDDQSKATKVDDSNLIDLPANDEELEFSDPPEVEEKDDDKPIITFKDRNADKFPVAKFKEHSDGFVVATQVPKKDGGTAINIIGAPEDTFYEGHYLAFGSKETAHFIIKKLQTVPAYGPAANDMEPYAIKRLLKAIGERDCIFVQNGQQFMQSAFPPADQLANDKKKEELKAKRAAKAKA